MMSRGCRHTFVSISLVGFCLLLGWSNVHSIKLMERHVHLNEPGRVEWEGFVTGTKAAAAGINDFPMTDASHIKEAKESGASITVETCPHYLAFSAEEISDGDTRFKCAPPIRDAVNRERLWKALKEGHIDMLSSDHSPSSPELKLLEKGDFLSAWGGISSLQGAIVSGNDADLVVWDPDVHFYIGENCTIYHKHSITPYAGKQLFGSVIATFVRGNLVYGGGQHASMACGSPILAS